MADFANSEEVRQLISEMRIVFHEPNDLQKAAVYPDRQGLVRSVSRYTAQDIPLLLLDDLSWRLVTTVGTHQTLRHFLPRIFHEALLGGGLGSTDWRTIAGKLPISEFERWTRHARYLTLTAMKLWIAKDEIDIAGLDVTAVLQMTMKDVIRLYDPYYGTEEFWWSRHHADTITYLVEEEERL